MVDLLHILVGDFEVKFVLKMLLDRLFDHKCSFLKSIECRYRVRVNQLRSFELLKQAFECLE